MTIRDPSMLLLSMLVDRSRIRYTVGWSFHCVMKTVYRKKESMKFNSTIETRMLNKVIEIQTKPKRKDRNHKEIIASHIVALEHYLNF
jgi:hypothetical protein